MLGLNVQMASKAGSSSRLNEDAVGYHETDRSVTMWVIDGATALPPATNEIIHRFGDVLSGLIKLHASSSSSSSSSNLVELARSALQKVPECSRSLYREILSLPRYAHPIASLVIARMTRTDTSFRVNFCVMGDCAIMTADDAYGMVVQQSRASDHLVQLLHEAQKTGSNQEVVRYQRNRRRRQQRKDYCRWATLDTFGCSRAIAGQSTLSDGDAVLLCSDGVYDPLLASGWNSKDILRFACEQGVGALIDKGQNLSAQSSAIRPKSVDDASAMLVHGNQMIEGGSERMHKT